MNRVSEGAGSASRERKQELALNEMLASLSADVIAFKLTVATINELVSRPEIQATAFAEVLGHVRDSLDGIPIYAVTANKVAAAFAGPARRATNRLNAGKLRSDGAPDAKELFDKWAESP